MKRFFAVLMILVVLVSICGCSQTSVNKNADVILTFVYGEDNISVTLEDDEAKKVIDILMETIMTLFRPAFPLVVLTRTFLLKLVGELSRLPVILVIVFKILAT